MAKKIKIRLRKDRKPYKLSKLLLFISVIILAVTVITSNILPLKYVLVLIGSLLILLALFSLLLKAKAGGRKPWKTFFSFVAIVISLALFASSYIVADVMKNLKKVFSEGSETDQVSVIALKDSEITDIKKLENINLGTFSISQFSEDNARCISDFKAKTDVLPNITEYDDMDEYVNALLNKEVDALVMSESFRGAISADYLGFNTGTKIIFSSARHEKSEALNPVNDISAEPFIVFLSGIDAYSFSDEVEHSDVNMIAAVNPKNKKILLVAIPRDYYVRIDGGDGMRDKLTHTGLYGIDCTVKTVEQLLDVEINYYAKVNFNSVVNLVDVLGGVEVYSEQSFSNPESGLSVQSGFNTFNGSQALAFCRERYSLPEGDKDRVKNQMQFVEGMVKKLLSPDTLFKYRQILECVASGVDTSITDDDMLALIKMQLGDMASWNISMLSMDGYDDYAQTYSGGSDELYVMVPYDDSVTAAQDAITELMSE